MAMTLRRERTTFWRQARREERRTRQPVPPLLPFGAVVRVPERGDVFVRYRPGPAGAPTVLLLHGWMASADLNWIGTFGALADRYHVVAMDHRGHGRGIRTTERFTLEDCADDAAGLLDALGVRSAIVAGYSMGGPISLLLARRHPHQVRGLVLVASAAELAPRGLERGMAVFARFLGPMFRSGLLDGALRLFAGREPAVLGDLAGAAPWMAGEMKRLHPSDVVGAGVAIAGFDGRAWVESLSVPAASVVTTRDRAVPPDNQLATAVALDGWVIELDAGHTVCVTDPEAMGAAVRQAVDLVAGRRWFGRAERWLRTRVITTATDQPSRSVGSYPAMDPITTDRTVELVETEPQRESSTFEAMSSSR